MRNIRYCCPEYGDDISCWPHITMYPGATMLQILLRPFRIWKIDKEDDVVGWLYDGLNIWTVEKLP